MSVPRTVFLLAALSALTLGATGCAPGSFVRSAPGWKVIELREALRTDYDEAWRVTFIAHDQQPCPAEGECPAVAPLGLSRYVIELAGGTAQEQNLQPGDTIVVLSEPPLP